jgi:nucleoside-diphosphate-sugar epimerase
MAALGGKTIFLTGATGVVGRAVLEKISGERVICLARRKSITHPNVVTILGDIAQPRFGLSLCEFEEYATQVDYIVHSAAATNFTKSEKMVQDTNVEGTKNVLEFAARANVPLCYISTAFAHSERHISDRYKQNAYERSKREAETLVGQSGLQHVIVRPSIIVGDSRTGRMAHFQGFHFLMDLTVKGMLPVPGAPAARVDFVPQDVVAAVVLGLMENTGITGEYWVTAGEKALTLQRAVELWLEHWGRIQGQDIKRPRFVDPDVVERLILPVVIPRVSPGTQMLFTRSLELVKFMNVETPFPSSLLELSMLLRTPLAFNPETTLVRNVEYFAAALPGSAQMPQLTPRG